MGDLLARRLPDSAIVAVSARAKIARNRSDHFAAHSQRLHHFGKPGEAEANENASVPIAISWRRGARKPSSSHLPFVLVEPEFKSLDYLGVELAGGGIAASNG
jgi:hypothetical protein